MLCDQGTENVNGSRVLSTVNVVTDDTVPSVYVVNVASETRPSSAQFMVSPGNGLSTTDPLTSMTAVGESQVNLPLVNPIGQMSPASRLRESAWKVAPPAVGPVPADAATAVL